MSGVDWRQSAGDELGGWAMNVIEDAVVFGGAGEQLIGVLARPDPIEDSSDVGVLVVVGGPQYRVGCHRQFLHLSRRVAAAGYPVFRFDYRGMGDSSGARRGFDAVSEDIGAAIDVFMSTCPTVKRVVLWGLCDGASASLIYTDATNDARVVGLILLNPWVRSEVTLAQTHIKHYYSSRLMKKEFWLKLLTGRLQVFKSIHDLVSSMLLARGSSAKQEDGSRSFQQRMLGGWKAMPGKVLLILSGQDYTAMEFLDFAQSHAEWSELIAGGRVTRLDVAEADHTFSCAAYRATVESATIEWLSGLIDSSAAVAGSSDRLS